MAQTHKLGTLATTVQTDDANDANVMRITYHNTEVVTVFSDQIILNTGGWFTATTKTRMNQASNQFNLGYSVYQKAGQWYCDYKGKTIKFKGDTLSLSR